MKLKPYPKYKDSGVQWIGKIPEEWEVRRFSSFGFFSSSGINKKTEPDEPLVKMVNYTDIYGNNSLVIDSKRELMTVSCPKGKIIFCNLKKGDIVFTPSSETEVDIGLSAVILENLKSTVFSYHVIRFRTIIKINLHFKKYIGNNHFVLSQFSSICKGTTRQILTHNDFKSILTILPPFQDQTVIANFLDKKAAEIDDLIEKDKKLIELLKEKRIALINHAVTKGLNPNVKMKDSGIEWIGEIPEGWYIGRLKNKTLIKYGSSLSELERSEGNINVFGSNGKIGKYNKSITKGKTIIIGRKGSHGKLNLSENSCFPIDTTYFIDNTCTKYDLKYLFYLVTQLKLDETSRDSAVPGLSREVAYNKIVPYIPKSEQRAIAEYLDKQTLKIDKTIQKIQKKINFLEEYKKSLIHHVVTGKIDVRGSGI